MPAEERNEPIDALRLTFLVAQIFVRFTVALTRIVYTDRHRTSVVLYYVEPLIGYESADVGD
jgi:hypothetical protein